MCIRDRDILEGVIQGVTHVQAPGYVGRGDNYGEGRSVGFRIAMKEALFLPVRVPLLLGLSRFIGLSEIKTFDHEMFLTISLFGSGESPSKPMRIAYPSSGLDSAFRFFWQK